MQKNKNSIIRLAHYRRVLNRLKSMGFVKVFSDNLADALGITPVQVRKDFSLYRLEGNRRGGYTIEDLVGRIDGILGKNMVQEVVIVGVGRIGKALINYQGFIKEGIKIVAGFDIDPSKLEPEGGVPVYPLEQLKEFVKARNIGVAIIAVPDIAAQQALDILLAAGVKGILNFAPIPLRASNDAVINNINVGLELETLIYFVHAFSKQEEPHESL